MSIARLQQVKLSNRPDSSRRYPICTEVEFHLPIDDFAKTTGAGRTTYISSGSIQFESSQRLPVGRLVELDVTWPARLDNDVLLKLHIIGRTAGVEGNYTTVRIARYEFRTRSAHSRKGRYDGQQDALAGRSDTVCAL